MNNIFGAPSFILLENISPQHQLWCWYLLKKVVFYWLKSVKWRLLFTLFLKSFLSLSLH